MKHPFHFLLIAVLFLCSCHKVRDFGATCYDKKQNQGEEAIDCGGKWCEPCGSCNDGRKNQDEEGVDCGGSCKPCPTCNDGIENQDETGVDCGGNCGPCPSCEDGKKNQNETGIDCGGTCEPCTTTACKTALGYGENGYLGSGKASLYVTRDGFDPDEVDDYFFSFNIYGDFPLNSSTCKQYIITLYKTNFQNLALNETQLLTTTNESGGGDLTNANKCKVLIYMAFDEYLSVHPEQKVYITRVGTSTFNLRFCKLNYFTSSKYYLSTNFSANFNFTL